MVKIDTILVVCKEPCSFSEIKNQFGWSAGVTYNMLHQLIRRGVLEKKSDGIYVTTKKGIMEIEKKIEEHDELNSEKLDHIANILVANILDKKRFELFDSVKLLKDVVRPSKETKELRTEIKKIYQHSVVENHHDVDLIQAIWASHSMTVCKHHGFDYDSAYESYANEIKQYMTKNDLRDRLRFLSFPTMKRLKINLNRKPRSIPSTTPKNK